MTMGNFFREYVYFPLGGSHGSRSRTFLNLIIVWSLTGLWHGASWNFVIWGLYFAVLLIAEKLFLEKTLKKIPGFFAWIYTFVIVMIGWSFFMRDSNSFAKMFAFTARLFEFGKVDNPVTVNMLNLQSNMPFLVLAAALSLPTRRVFTWISQKFSSVNKGGIISITLDYVNDIVYIVIFILCVVQIVADSYNPFIYFRF